MICDVCKKKKATVHLTEIIDGKMAEMHICEDCAKERSVQMEQQFGLADLLAGLSDFGKQVKTEEKAKLQCENCSLSYEDFRKFGRLGCSECYRTFRAHLSSLLKKIHGSNQHFGKKPLQLAEASLASAEQESQGKVAPPKEDNLQDLKMKLQQAVFSENFEQAAILRDHIRTLEKKERE